jgi:hypothetical protein
MPGNQSVLPPLLDPEPPRREVSLPYGAAVALFRADKPVCNQASCPYRRHTGLVTIARAVARRDLAGPSCLIAVQIVRDRTDRATNNLDFLTVLHFHACHDPH